MTLEEEQIKQLVDAPVQKFCLLKDNYVSYKLLSNLDTDPTSFTLQDKVVRLPLCNLYYVNCLSVFTAYLIQIPGFYLSFNPAYIRIRRHEALDRTLYRNTRFIHQDKNINVIHSDDGATLISAADLSRVIKRDMVRRSSTKD